MKVIMYKGKTRLFNKVVSWWFDGPYSHCEVVTMEEGSQGNYCYSSSFQDGGVRGKWIKINPDNWDVIELDIDASEYEFMICWFEDRIREGARYDTLGLLGYVFRRISASKSAYVCCHAVAASLGFYDPWRFEPNTLAAALRRLALRNVPDNASLTLSTS